jgi:IS5 family transposase
MKTHIGIDSRTKLIHAAVATPANVADSTVLPDLLYGNETRVWGDQAYRGQRAVIADTRCERKTLSIAATATAVLSMRSSERKTVPSPKCGLGSNIRSGSSSGCSASPKCAIAS